jgi:hypothetical protein
MNMPISRWPVPDINSLPDDMKARILDVQAKAGFVPNVFLALAHRPGRVARLHGLPRRPAAPRRTPAA